MRALLQRVTEARVSVAGEAVGAIGPGLLVLLGVGHGDGEKEALALATKTANLRIFEDEQGKVNLSLLDTSGEALVVSQFTLYADTRKGRRPSFTDAAEPESAKALVASYREALEAAGVPTAGGRFGAAMQVTLTNDGPFTVTLDTADLVRSDP
jgi:D-tyrosyl-tRNA(Tyr) deacylase